MPLTLRRAVWPFVEYPALRIACTRLLALARVGSNSTRANPRPVLTEARFTPGMARRACSSDGPEPQRSRWGQRDAGGGRDGRRVALRLPIEVAHALLGAEVKGLAAVFTAGGGRFGGGRHSTDGGTTHPGFFLPSLPEG